MDRSVYIVALDMGETKQYWDGASFGPSEKVHLFEDKLQARAVAAQMQQVFPSAEVTASPATVTIAIGA